MRGGDHHARILIDLSDAYHGATRTIALRAAKLDSTGRVVTEERTLNVQVPKGVKEGQHIRLAGQGSPGMGGGPAGDLYLEVNFSPDPRYRVDGRDVYEIIPVAPWEATLGTSIEVPTPSGNVQVKVPAGSQAGRKLRLKGRGIPGNPPGICIWCWKWCCRPPTRTRRGKFQTMARSLRSIRVKNWGVSHGAR
jgi:curved DNA-binding protein